MPSATPNMRWSNCMIDETALVCIEIFRKSAGLDRSPRGNAMSNNDVVFAPIDSFDMDSLDTMEFVMAVEDRFDILLDEEAVNGCKTLADFAKLVVEARGV
jgi:acyl carrier protein